MPRICHLINVIVPQINASSQLIYYYMSGKIKISQAFPDLDSFTLVNSGKLNAYDWYHISNSTTPLLPQSKK